MLALAALVSLGASSLAGASDLGNDDDTTNDFVCPSALTQASSQYSTHAFAVPVDDGYYLPILSSQPEASRTTTVAILLHGATRNVDEYYRNMVSMRDVIDCGAWETTMAVVAPALVPAPANCPSKTWTGKGSSLDEPVTWSGTHEWALGQKDDRGTNGVSSFTALDKVIEWAISRWFRSLQHFVVTGFSTGAQLVLRWAIFSPQGESAETVPHSSTSKRFTVRVVVASPSTVTYLDDKRPSLNCTAEETSASDRCDSFAVPESGSRRRNSYVQRTCEGEYDDYHYGLSGLSGASAGSAAADVADYLGATVMNAANVPEVLRQRFKSKDIRFLVGSEDVRACGTGSCSQSCEADTTGLNRLQRMLNYMGHLEDVLGQAPSFAVFDGAHENLLAFRSTEFLEWGFPGLVVEGADGNPAECDTSALNGGVKVAPRLFATLTVCLGVLLSPLVISV